MRARIDGKVVSLDEAPELKKNFKHTIEAVVDRLAVKPDQGQRLAESFETAIHLGEGLVRVVVLNEDNSAKDEIVFSARYACPHCGYSISELEPRLFSFNNPAGACPTCDGLGVRQFFRSGAHPHRCVAAAAGGRHPRLGPAQCVLLPDARIARASLRLQPRYAV